MPHIEDLTAVKIETAALNAVPESVAREMCVLPVSSSDGAIHFVLPTDRNIAGKVDKLRYILNLTVTFDTAHRKAIEAAINQNYPTERGNSEELTLPEALPSLDQTVDYRFLDLVGQITSFTVASVSFDLGQKVDYLDYSNGKRDDILKGRVFNVVGWLDSHYPCQGLHKLFIRCSLPGDYVGYESMRELVADVAKTLGLPHNMPYHIHLQTHSHTRSMEHPQSGFICTRKWRMPDDE